MTRHYEDGLAYTVQTLDGNEIVLDKSDPINLETIDNLRHIDEARRQAPKNMSRIRLLALAAIPKSLLANN